MCMGMGQPILIPPSEKGRAMADYLRTCLVLALLLALTEFIGTKYVSGVFDILAAAIGYMAIRNPEGFNYQQGADSRQQNLTACCWLLLSS
jgi:hypothetical protein